MINAIVQVMLFSVIPFVWWSFTAKKEQTFLEWLGFHRPVIVNKGKYAILYMLAIVVLVVPNFALVFFYMDNSILASHQFAGLGLSGIIPALLYAMIQTGKVIWFPGRKFATKPRFWLYPWGYVMDGITISNHLVSCTIYGASRLCVGMDE
jgi:hypothetical protein